MWHKLSPTLDEWLITTAKYVFTFYSKKIFWEIFLQFSLALKLVNVLLRHAEAKSILEIEKLELLLNLRSNLETILSLFIARNLMQSNHLPPEQLQQPFSSPSS